MLLLLIWSFMFFVSEDQQTILTGTKMAKSTNKMDFIATATKVNTPAPSGTKQLASGVSISEIEFYLNNSAGYSLPSGSEIPGNGNNGRRLPKRGQLHYHLLLLLEVG